jgi:hypothetical protein
MNYLKHYCCLIRKAENRTPPEGYTEKHHIFPVSIYGKNNRVVILTAREHYIAHALLEKIFIKRCGLKHYKTIKMTLAHSGMRGNGGYINSYLYEGAKMRRSEIMRGNRNGVGKKQTEEQKKVISKRSKEMWKTGVFSTKEYREKLSMSLCKKEYKITNKNGDIYYTNNIVKFSKEFGIDFSPLYKMAKGKMTFYKEWISVEVL